MSQTPEFYEARVAEAQAEADAAKLDNVRDRALRSRAVWQDLADRARGVTDQRRRIADRKAHERAEG